jgi:hypothetical protein
MMLVAAAAADSALAQVVQVVGAVLILVAFVLAQLGRLAPSALPYLWLNLVGSAILAVLAALGSNWGFLLLEGVWAIVSAWSLWARARGREPTAAH